MYHAKSISFTRIIIDEVCQSLSLTNLSIKIRAEVIYQKLNSIVGGDERFHYLYLLAMSFYMALKELKTQNSPSISSVIDAFPKLDEEITIEKFWVTVLRIKMLYN